jgi:DNA topoisomerase I
MKTLLIVESPAKCKKIESYLGEDYKCVASFGHLRELTSLNDIVLSPSDWKLTFQNISIKKKQIDLLEKEIKKADTVLLATDDDREGEAIAWHICILFHLNVHKTKRIKFHEITKSALQHAVKNPTYLDLPLIYAQQSRQIMDLIVGYKISPLLWRSIAKNLSAGRCQTPALRLVYDNYKDIQINMGKQIYETTGYFTSYNIPFVLNKQIEQKQHCEEFLEECVNHTFVLKTLPQYSSTKKPPLPFITSTLQQTVSNELHISPKETMKICQELYENGYITYMRTDNKKYCSQFIQSARDYITKQYTDSYISTRLHEIEIKTEKSSNKLTQEAHEAIRPTNIERTTVDEKFSAKTKKVYSLIWKNTVQSCMKDAILHHIKGIISAPFEYQFEYISCKIHFDGFMILDKNIKSEKEFIYFSKLKEKLEIKYKKIVSQFKLIELKNHYTEARLVQLLEEKGIGRPSTFSMLIDKIQERKYVEKTNISGKKIECIDFELIEEELNEIKSTKEFGNEKNKLVITNTGILVIEYLLTHFPSFFDYEYTKELEDKLDLISQDKLKGPELCYQVSNELTSMIDKLKTPKLNIKIDEHHSYVITSKGPAICKKENKETTYFPVKQHIDLEKLKNHEYKLEDLIRIDTSLGKYEDQDIFIKKGKFGLYAEYGENKISLSSLGNRPIENVTLKEVLNVLENSSGGKPSVRKITEECCIKRGKFGDYIFYQTKEMKKPSFLKLQKCPMNYKHGNLEELKQWINQTYSLQL